MKIQFTAATEITISPAQTVTIPEKIINVPANTKTLNEITIKLMVDDPIKKQVTARTNELGNFILWQNEEYDAIGQWTDQDVIDRIKEIYNIV
jgi:hypothetical protein